MDTLILLCCVVTVIVVIKMNGKLADVKYFTYEMWRDLAELQRKVEKMRMAEDHNDVVKNDENEALEPSVAVPADVVADETPRTELDETSLAACPYEEKEAVVFETVVPECPPVPESDVVGRSEISGSESGTEECHEDHRRNIERLIGVDVFSKIGMLVLVVGIGFFVKYAIDNDWINEIGRVVLGFVSGFILWAVAYKLREDYVKFSSILAGGGFAVCFVTAAVGYNYYRLFSSPVAFSILVALMVAMVVIALRWSRKWLAVIAIVGGFVTPFLVGDKNGSFIAFCGYLALLDTAIFVITLRRNWWELHIAGCFLTYIAQLIVHPSQPVAVLAASFLFNLYFLVLFSLPLVTVLRRNRDRSAIFALLLGSLIFNDFACLIVSLYCLNRIPVLSSFPGLCPLIVAGVNAAVFMRYYVRSSDGLIRNILLGVIIVFSLLFIPIQFSSLNVIVSCVAVSSFMLFLVYAFTRYRIFIISSAVCLAVVAAGLLFRMMSVPESLFSSSDFWGFAVSGTSIVAISCIMRRFSTSMFAADPGVAVRYIALTLWLGLLIVIVGSCYRLNAIFPADVAARASLLLLLSVFLSVSLSVRDSGRAGWVIPGASVFGYVMIMFTPSSFAGDLIMVACDVVLAVLFVKEGLKRLRSAFPMYTEYMVYYNFAAMAFVVSAVEAVLLAADFNSALSAGFSVVVMLCGVIQLVIGMRCHSKVMRIIGLCSLGIVLVKLVFYDLWMLPAVGRIIVFILLGVILLVVSFLYQRLRSALFDDRG